MHRRHPAQATLLLLLTALVAPCWGCLESADPLANLPPQCVPGRIVACPCLGGAQGYQTCAEDGKRFMQCVCPNASAALTASPTASPFPSSSPSAFPSARPSEEMTSPPSPSALTPPPSLGDPLEALAPEEPDPLTSKLTQPQRRPAPPNTPTQEPQEEIELKPIILSRADTPAVEPDGSGSGRQRWWLVSASAARCLSTDSGEEAQHPVRLLAAGCYIKQRSAGLMTVKCDDPNSGARTLEYTETLARCQEIVNPRDRLPPRLSPAPRDAGREEPALNTMNIKRGDREWHCLCYEEVYQGAPSLSTACRATRESCLELAAKVDEGTPLLIKGSVSVGCKRYSMREPWDNFGVRYQWLPSSQPGSWWTPRGCFLDPSAPRRPARRAATRAPSSPSPSSPSLSPAPTTSASLKGVTPDSCEQTCWAHLAPTSDLARRFGGSSIPKALEWGRPFADRVNLLLKTCIARKEKQGPSASGRQACLDEGVKACARFCERSKG